MWYLVCTDPAFTGSGSCTGSWVFVERFPPALTTTQGLSLLSVIVGVWGLAYIFRFFRRFLRS